VLRVMVMPRSLGHLSGSMLYLWIFEDNQEDRLGIPLYVAFYLVCGGARW